MSNGMQDLGQTIGAAMAEQAAEPKPWWQSRTIIGAVVVAAASVLHMAGVDVDQGAATEILLGLGQLAGAALAVYGRIVATRPIRLRRG